MKKLFAISLVILTVNLTACTENKTILRSQAYYMEHLDEAERIAQQCKKEKMNLLKSTLMSPGKSSIL
ncbi:hypothetical protein BKK56_11635 [Rodentibacter genomosp. 2]|uniref:EexN family lipoprotein n=1 Tax=Rodentibacter genomosp. 2 TaxID=1908266 RepID=UPI0009857A8A|nr:hypothetical protein BKK56_11635 [Rodentibacter genomosp. 2]